MWSWRRVSWGSQQGPDTSANHACWCASCSNSHGWVFKGTSWKWCRLVLQLRVIPQWKLTLRLWQKEMYLLLAPSPEQEMREDQILCGWDLCQITPACPEMNCFWGHFHPWGEDNLTQLLMAILPNTISELKFIFLSLSSKALHSRLCFPFQCLFLKIL